jgi:uncharacterized membrane protein
MKTSLIIGVVQLYLVIVFCEMVVTGASIFAPALTSQQGVLSSPTMASSSIATFITNAGQFLAALIPALLLYSPTVFSGNMAWVWWFTCFPIDVGIVASIIWIVRGVQSS